MSYTNDMMVHNFANDIECHNRNLKVEKVYFNGGLIIGLYSYNTIIAFKYNGVTYGNFTYYSNTTSKHQSLVRRYCNVTPVNDNFFDFYLGLHVKKDVTYFKQEIRHLVGKIERARTNGEHYTRDLNSYINTLKITVNTFYKVDKRSKWYKDYIKIVSDPMAYYKDYDAKKRVMSEKARKARIKRLKKEEKVAKDFLNSLDTKSYYEYKTLAKVNDIFAKFPQLRNANLLNFMTVRNALKLSLNARVTAFRRFGHHDINRHLLAYINAIIARDEKEIARRFDLVNIRKLYDLFMAGKIKEIPRDYKILGDTFKIKGNHLISTQNVTLSFNDAKKFYLAYKANKLQLNEIVAGFRITAIESNYIQIGCHRFEPDNIEKVYTMIKGL